MRNSAQRVETRTHSRNHTVASDQIPQQSVTDQESSKSEAEAPGMESARPKKPLFGMAFWMERVLEGVEGAGQDLTADQVHDLRVALRRCRSMAEGFMAIDPDGAWKALQKESRQLFRRLGRLRDVQVLEGWIGRLGNPEDRLTIAMRLHLGQQEEEVRRGALAALKVFDSEKWRGWIGRLQARARRLPEGGVVFQLSALQAWNEAHELHKRALRDRSAAGYHRLRIGIKRFRYIVENFLPLLHARWGQDLKEIQDSLGEVHDLSVFWETALRLSSFGDAESKERWRALVAEQTAIRLDKYRGKMVGSHSLWNNWRQELPAENRLPAMGLKQLEKWAWFHGIDLDRARAVRRLALQLLGGLRAGKRADIKSRRAILHFAAILHELGNAKRKKGGRRPAARLLLELPPTPGFTADERQCAAIVILGHRGKFRGFEGEEYAVLPEAQRQLAIELCGILRLARVLALNSDPEIRSLEVEMDEKSIVILSPGYSEFGPLAEKAARARYLLERALQKPILIRNASADEPG